MRLRALAVVLWFAVAAVSAGGEKKDPQPKTAGAESDPPIQLELKGPGGDDRAGVLLACLNQLPWATRTAVLPQYPGIIARERLHPKATAVAAVGPRKWADVVDLVGRVRKAGFTVSGIYLTQFGTVRIRTQFTLDKPTHEAGQSIAAVYCQMPWLVDARYTEAGTKPEIKL